MAPATRPRKLVVAGLITNATGDVLLTERREDQPMPRFWEFPGGKIEPGEAPEVALARELREELGVDAIVDAVWHVVFHAYPEFDLYLLVYRCRLAVGATPRPVEVRDLAWVAPAELPAYRILPADEPLVRRLVRESATALT